MPRTSELADDAECEVALELRSAGAERAHAGSDSAVARRDQQRGLADPCRAFYS
jgi:hypothetical protein